MGRLELPLPEIGKPLEDSAKAMESKIRAQVTPEYRKSIVVRAFKKGQRTGVVIEYDDRVENQVYVAMEYPKGSAREECSAPGKKPC